ncbi:SOS response-associated peptidase family protein [Saccharospirillum alexandrii]|uniref:SOS response-associated peptidase family protein n=1 Tax=Saccharospirillum alexandrii TaxID=2448477 RepID=UPI000FDC9F35|nr:SOS response-associated peptidase family protein [Saccharospirillum alexandrii]
MCGAINNVSDFPLLDPLLGLAGYSEAEIRSVLNKRECRPTDDVLALVPTKLGPRLMAATWWLKLDPDTLLPDTRWNTFNCRSSQILKSPLHQMAPRSYRAVVITDGFYEWQPRYAGGRLYSDLSAEEQQHLPRPQSKQRHWIHRPGELMLLGALCKHWLDAEGNPKVSVGVITLPPHPAFLDVHAKSFPLVLRPEELEDWVNPRLRHEQFGSLFVQTEVRVDVEVQAINDQEFDLIPEEPLILRAPQV